MDACCLNRPFDDQSQNKIHMESEAILSILGNCTKGHWNLIGSDIIELEIRQGKDLHKMQQALSLHNISIKKLQYDARVKERAKEFQIHNVKLFDSLHLALAEYEEVDIFLTVDHQLINASKRTDIKIMVSNPVNWLMEVLGYE